MELWRCDACGTIEFSDGYSRCSNCRAGIFYQICIERPTPQQIQIAHNNRAFICARTLLTLLLPADENTKRGIKEMISKA